ncbi:DUF6105 family protein [Pseudahrensia aquimaris]|uniref:DUF6105 family protein n=1 Tax=Pseudahrensia aquimaris TaxID=744461 RepID=A0ABW3FJT7_9HYPH
MKTWLKLWSLPLGFLIVWFTLSYNDWNFGTFLFSREMHDQFLELYARMLGVEISELPSLLLKALVFDGALLLTIYLFVKKRKRIFAWAKRKIAAFRERGDATA